MCDLLVNLYSLYWVLSKVLLYMTFLLLAFTFCIYLVFNGECGNSKTLNNISSDVYSQNFIDANIKRRK